MVFIYAFQKLPLHLHYMSFFSLSPFFDFKYYNAYLQALPVNLFFFFFLMFLLPSLGVESRCMASATIRMYSQSPCWVKSFNFLISSFQIMLISFSFLKSPSPKFRDNFQNNENLHESSETDFELNYNAVSITQSFKDTVMWNIPLCFLQQMWKEFQIAVSEWGLGSKKQLFVLTRNSISV